jgi:G3E family GTPase
MISPATSTQETTRQDKRPPPPFPLTILTGFLGAGKTSLLNRLLRDPALAETLVIINEFGEIGLDHLLVEQSGDDMLVMTSGCLCCSIRGDLISTLEDVLRRRDNGRITPFQRVVIETTGLADPAPVLHTIMYHPYLMLRFRLDGVVTLVDAVNGAATLDVHEEAVKQAAMADRLVLTKTDLLVDPAGARLAELRARLNSLNPSALLLDAAKGEATAASLLEAGLYDPARKTLDVRRWLNAEAFLPNAKEGILARDPDHPGEHHHAHENGQVEHGLENHDVNRHDFRIRAFCMRHQPPISPAAFDLFLELLRNAHGPNLLRVKGIVALADDPSRPVVIHGVQHVFHPPVRLTAWPDEDHDTRVVFILRDMKPAFVEGLWKAFAGVPGLDSADSAAITANPLAPSKGGLLA